MVVLLVAALEAREDRDRVVPRGLRHRHRLEPARERGILLHAAELVQRRRADEAQLATGQARLEDVAGVHAAGVSPAAGTQHHVHLVDEDDELALARADLLEQRREALLEVAPVLRASDHRRQVQGDDAATGQLRGHLVVRDRLGEALRDRGLAHTGLADEHGVVLRAAGQDLDRLRDLLVAADDRVQPALGGLRREVMTVLVQHGRRRGLPRLRLRRLLRRPGLCGLGGGLLERLRGHARTLQQLPRVRVLVEDERDEDVLRVDVGRAEPAGHLVGVQQRLLGRLGERHLAGHAGLRALGQTRLRVLRDRVRVRTGRRDLRADLLVVHHDAQQVEDVDLRMAVLGGEGAGGTQQLVGAAREQARDVDGPARRPLVLQQASEEVLEGVAARAGRAEEGCHECSWKIE